MRNDHGTASHASDRLQTADRSGIPIRRSKPERAREAKRHLSQLIRVWIEKYERGEFDEEVEAANMLEHYEARIAALERMVGRLALENELLKKVSQASRPPKDGRPSVITGPPALPSPKVVA
jgi:transposase